MSTCEDKRRSGDFMFVAAMPYLSLKETAGDEYFALIPGDDSFLNPFKSQSRAIAALMDNFQTPWGVRLGPLPCFFETDCLGTR
jgi:hypothetical protein